MSKSPTIIEEMWPSADPAEWLDNPHAGEMLRSEFMEPLAMSATDLAAHIDADARHIEDVIAGRAPMDADLDLRLARYFRMSQGFFMRLQVSYQLLERKRQLAARGLDYIVPRAA